MKKTAWMSDELGPSRPSGHALPAEGSGAPWGTSSGNHPLSPMDSPGGEGRAGLLYKHLHTECVSDDSFLETTYDK